MLFKPAETTSAYLKMGLLGFAGTGKTKTATITAVGLVQLMRELGLPQGERPAFFLDTETGSDWVRADFETVNIELYTAKTRAFTDLIAAVQEAEKGASILLVDSITHFWTEFCEAYRKRKNRTRLQFEDWNYLKGMDGWGKFTDLYINSQLHIILCGRAGYEYNYFEDEETGKKQLEKTGIKMKAESEMGYEPSLLVLMERETDLETLKVHRTAHVLKDRGSLIDGAAFKNPTFEHFAPHIKRLNLGGVQLGVDTTRTSERAIPQDHRDNRRIQREIVLEEIESLLVKHYPGQTATDKRAKLDLLKDHWNSSSWTEMQKVKTLDELRHGYNRAHLLLEGKPSRYANADALDELLQTDSENPAEGMATEAAE